MATSGWHSDQGSLGVIRVRLQLPKSHISGILISYSEQKEFSRDSTNSSNESEEQPRNLALKDLDFVINPGEKVAICGRSGRYVL
jgi:ABC-type multidrug transport system fused ATPase/permease subunit